MFFKLKLRSRVLDSSTDNKRDTLANRLSLATVVVLGVYFFLLIFFFDETRHDQDNLATLALFLGILSIILSPPRERPAWPYWVFVGGLVCFYLLNLLAVHLAPDLPDIGHTSSRMVHLPKLLLALAAGIGLRRQRHAFYLLICILVISGLGYLGEAISIPWRDGIYMHGRLMLDRGYHVRLAIELLMLFSLFMAYALLRRFGYSSLIYLAGVLLFGALLFLTKTRFALLTMFFVTIPCAVLVQRKVGTIKQKIIVAGLIFFLVAPGVGGIWYLTASKERRSPTNALLRIKAYKSVAIIAKRSPLPRVVLGYGRFSHTYEAVSKKYGVNVEETPNVSLAHAHNVFVQTFLETGVAGTLVLIIIYGVAFYRAVTGWIRGRTETGAVAGVMIVAIITLTVMGQMDHCLNQSITGRLGWFMIGLAFASGAVAKPGSDVETSEC